jgi:hypothetical protein
MHTGPPKLVQNQPGKQFFLIGVNVRENYLLAILTRVSHWLRISPIKKSPVADRAQFWVPFWYPWLENG